MAVSPWQEALTGFDVLAITLMIGGVIATLWLLPNTAAAALRAAMLRRLRIFLGGALILLTLTTAVLIFARSADISGIPLRDAGTVVPLVLTRTDFGRMWSARAAAVLLSWLAWSAWQPSRRWRFVPWGLLVAVAIIAFTRGATGHAGDHGDFRLAVWLDWLHLLAAGLWGGVIIAFVVAVRPALRHRSAATPEVAAIVRRFSTIAAVGLGFVVATGVYNAWRALGGWQPLWTSHYGRILDVKLGLVILMALLGASNRFRHVPRVVSASKASSDKISSLSSAVRLLLVTAAAEALLMLAIIAAVALLLHAMPPAALA